MPLWRFVPVADPEDDRWLDYEYWDEVIVRAETLGRAIATAALVLGRPEVRMGNETAADRTAIEDPKLFRAERVEPAELGLAEAAAEGPPTVLRAVREGTDTLAEAS